MAPQQIRELRRALRYRNLLVRQRTQTKNKVSGLLMEAGIEYNKQKLHQKRYFSDLLQRQGAEQLPTSLTPLLQLSRTTLDALGKMERQLLAGLERDGLLAEQVQRLMSIPGVGATQDRVPAGRGDSGISRKKPRTSLLQQEKTQAQRKNCRLWKSGNPKARFPLSHSLECLRRKEKSNPARRRFLCAVEAYAAVKQRNLPGLAQWG